jgi:hypothetical protein
MSEILANKLSPSTGTAVQIGDSGDTITIPSGATFTQSGTMNASAITAGTMATARLGSGTADGTTFLRGDQTYAAPGGGKILQVVQDIHTSVVSNNTNTFTDSGISQAITCSATSSKVLVMVTQSYAKGNSTSYVAQLMRDSSVIDVLDGIGYTGSTLVQYGYYAFTYLDSPSSTSALTYKTQFKSGDNVAYAQSQVNGNPSTITLMEIGA